jgi:hypothetical protein
MRRSNRVLERLPCAQKRTSGAEAREDFHALTARVKLVRFPIMEWLKVFSGLKAAGRCKVLLEFRYESLDGDAWNF